MKQVITFIILLLIIGLGYWVLTSNDTPETTTDVEVSADIENTNEISSDSEAELDRINDEDTTESTDDSRTHVFDIESFMHGYSIDEIRVQQGDTVTINLTNTEGLHDWVVDEFNAATEIISAGEETSITFIADQQGTFEYYCSVGNHRALGMVGTLIVE